jgi:hypothetical protein
MKASPFKKNNVVPSGAFISYQHAVTLLLLECHLFDSPAILCRRKNAAFAKFRYGRISKVLNEVVSSVGIVHWLIKLIVKSHTALSHGVT